MNKPAECPLYPQKREPIWQAALAEVTALGRIVNRTATLT
jgi:hypothetical protein